MEGLEAPLDTKRLYPLVPQVCCPQTGRIPVVANHNHGGLAPPNLIQQFHGSRRGEEGLDAIRHREHCIRVPKQIPIRQLGCQPVQGQVDRVGEVRRLERGRAPKVQDQGDAVVRSPGAMNGAAFGGAGPSAR